MVSVITSLPEAKFDDGDSSSAVIFDDDGPYTLSSTSRVGKNGEGRRHGHSLYIPCTPATRLRETGRSSNRRLVDIATVLNANFGALQRRRSEQGPLPNCPGSLGSLQLPDWRHTELLTVVDRSNPP
jgi:hypothetical protein